MSTETELEKIPRLVGALAGRAGSAVVEAVEEETEVEKFWPVVARVAAGAIAGNILESQKTSSVQKVAPLTPSRKRHDDALGSGPEVEKTFHDDIDTGADFSDAATLVGSALLGAYLGRKFGRKLGRGAGGLADALKGAAKKAVDYQQATTWPSSQTVYQQQKQNNPFAIATAQAKKMGYDDFSEGSAGRRKRGKIAEAIKEESAVSKLVKAVEGLKEGLLDGGQSGKSYTDSSKNIDTPKKKSALLPKDHKPDKKFMLKKDSCNCGCSQ